MSEKKSTGIPFFNIWVTGQEQFNKAQSDWMSPGSSLANNMETNEFVEKSKIGWQKCEEQFNNWMKVSENWFSAPQELSAEENEEDISTQALRYMLNPNNFLKSGLDQMNQIFRKLVDGPDFADIGILEKKFLKSSRDWLAFREAVEEFQETIAAAWSRAFTVYSDEFPKMSDSAPFDSKALLDRWLKIADEELVSTLRSAEFLVAQRNLFSTGTAYKLKHREFVEMWCENHSIPTRSEVDDLHKIIYELRREIRELKKPSSPVKKNKENPLAEMTGSLS